ncbi:hypothetical protein O1611_g3437 [Lasiodiplodia mahajangana]|uniref:Uncharacterized protein n=1 Tax=Lasiodiplodia mahajangana TaxID=1108764 RepID=A0ACC2JSM5_9PEZI|nr:hypothetical protein O1611_g3437 [Lasiodiplodia mahajangana]
MLIPQVRPALFCASLNHNAVSIPPSASTRAVPGPTLDDAMALEKGCREPLQIQNRLPFGLDRVWAIIMADRDGWLMEGFKSNFQLVGNSMKQVFLGSPAYGTIEPANLKAIFSTERKDFSFGLRRECALPILGDGIFTQEGEQHENSRRTLKSQFSKSRYANLQVFREPVEDLLQILPEAGVVDLQPLFFKLTLDAATAFMCGKSVKSLLTPENHEEKTFAQAFDTAQTYVLNRMRLQNWYWLIGGIWVRGACRKINTFTDQIIDESLADSETKEGQNDERYKFLKAAAEAHPDRASLRGQILNILVAGRDTTACLLSWTFFVLVRHREVMEKLRDEINALDVKEEDITRAHLFDLKYLQNVLKEVLRLYPPAPLNTRSSTKTTILPTGGGPDGTSPVLIPKGTAVGFSIYALHRRPEFFGMHAETFRPDRWDDLKEKEVTQNCDYLPFGGGSRLCLGKDFSLTEAAYVIVRILKRYPEIGLPEGERLQLLGVEKQTTTLTLQLMNGCKGSTIETGHIGTTGLVRSDSSDAARTRHLNSSFSPLHRPKESLNPTQVNWIFRQRIVIKPRESNMLLAILLNFFQAPLMCVSSISTIFRSSTSLSSNSSLRDILPQIEVLRGIGGTAGMSIGVMRQGRVVLEHNFGLADVENNTVASSSTRYPLGSLTKAFVAATIAQLVHNGVLDWRAPITTYIPELSFQADPTLAKRLTLLDILSHNTGLIRLDALWLGAENEVIIPKNYTITVCNHLRPMYSLRSKWFYNNWMYALAGEVIERVTNMSWGQALDEKVLRKLGLGQTTVYKSAIPKGSTALPYLVLDDKSLVRTGNLGLTDGDLMSSAGGVRSTVHDMLSWGNSLLATFRDEEGPLFSMDTIFSGQSFMEPSAKLDELYSMGFAKVMTPIQFGKLGFNPSLIDTMPTIGGGPSRQVFYHNGILTGYNNCFMIIPSLDTVIVVLTNSISQGDTADWAAQTLLQAVLDTESPVDIVPFAERASEKWRTMHASISNILNVERTPGTDEPYHRELVGIYSHPTGALYLEVYEDKNNDLMFNINGKKSQAHVLSHYHYHTFVFLPSSDERIRRGLFHYEPYAWLLSFEKNAQGDVDRVVWRLDDQETTEGEAFIRQTESDFTAYTRRVEVDPIGSFSSGTKKNPQ